MYEGVHLAEPHVSRDPQLDSLLDVLFQNHTLGGAHDIVAATSLTTCAGAYYQAGADVRCFAGHELPEVGELGD